MTIGMKKSALKVLKTLRRGPPKGSTKKICFRNTCSPPPGPPVPDTRGLKHMNNFAIEHSEIRGTVGERRNEDQYVSTTETGTPEGLY